ncbi:uncharacterized protein LOC117568555 [Drosophila albomicans]|uniref:Uncharacterized protein LOC117568555 n=1 Tax=Drosophila albomicans TaxID=7291 RepID=A0A6P8WSF2_DROAB|nr:uncharacterized protein LOC117568555 [Drosophila albomicans]
MLSCIRLRCVAAHPRHWGNRFPQQLRLLADEESNKNRDKKYGKLWNKQIGELVRKRNMLALIGEYVELQEKYVDSRLRSNKMLIELAKAVWSYETLSHGKSQ